LSKTNQFLLFSTYELAHTFLLVRITNQFAIASKTTAQIGSMIEGKRKILAF
jgi:hypothetical protein